MKKIVYLLSIFFSTLVFVSCEDVIEFDEKESKPMLIAHVMATPDSILYAQITKSIFFLDITSDPLKDKDGNYLGVRDAVVKLYVNNIYKENMLLVSGDSGIYKASYIPKEYDQIKIVVSSPLFDKEAEGVTTLPKTMTMTVDTTISYEEGVEMSYNTGGPPTSDSVLWKRTHYTIHFADNGGEENYYGVAVLVDAPLYLMNNFMLDSLDNPLPINTEDKVLFDGTKSDPKILIFEDKKINGQAYNFTFYTDERVFSATDSIFLNISPAPPKKRLKFYSFNKDAYLFLSSAKKNFETSGMSIFAEPSQVYSNIKNGIGIIGGFSIAVKAY